MPQPRGKAWFEEEQARWHKYWESHFSGMKDELHACCIKDFNDCVSGSGRWTAGGTEACVQKYSPEHQPKVAVPGAPAASKVAVAEGQSLEQQYLSCRKERGEFQQQVAQAKKEQLELQERGRQEQLASEESLRQKQHALQESVRQGEAFSKDLAVCQATAAAQKTDLAGLQQQLQQTGYIPGMAALAAFPEGSGSIELGLLAVGSLVAGFLFGWAGRRRRLARLAAGSAGALFTLLVFLAIIALLPDTGWPELLFALTTAALLMSLAALRRLARLRDRHRHAPEAAVAEEDIDLDEAEKALLKRGEDAG